MSQTPSAPPLLDWYAIHALTPVKGPPGEAVSAVVVWGVVIGAAVGSGNCVVRFVGLTEVDVDTDMGAVVDTDVTFAGVAAPPQAEISTAAVAMTEIDFVLMPSRQPDRPGRSRVGRV